MIQDTYIPNRSQGGTMMSDEHFLSMREAAHRLGVSVATVRRLIETEELPAKRLGRQLRVPSKEFETWCEELQSPTR